MASTYVILTSSKPPHLEVRCRATITA